MSGLLPSSHRLGPGLPGYLIPFAPLAFAPQRQKRSSVPPSPPEFLCDINAFHRSTGQFRTPLPPSRPPVSEARSPVELEDFTPDLAARLRTL